MLSIVSETDLVLKEKIQCLYFYTSWMQCHGKMITMLSKMEKKYPDIEFFGIDLDFFKTFIKRFDVNSVPTVILFKNGKEKKRLTGLVMTSAMKSAFVDIYDLGD